MNHVLRSFLICLCVFVSGGICGGWLTMWVYGKRLERSGFTFAQMQTLLHDLPQAIGNQQDALDDMTQLGADTYRRLFRGDVEEARQSLRKLIVFYAQTEPPAKRIPLDPISSRAGALNAVQRAMDEDDTLRAELEKVWGPGWKRLPFPPTSK